jgi:hypothetical protein
MVEESIDEATTMYCPQCGAEWEGEALAWVACPECGFEFGLLSDDESENESEPAIASEQPGLSDQLLSLSSPQFEPLLEAAGPDLYRANAFRVLGLQTESTEREIARHSQRVRFQTSAGLTDRMKEPLSLDPPPDLDALQRAEQRLRDPERRLVDEFFWFWPLQQEGHEDEPLRALSQGDVRLAYQLWKKDEVRSDDGVSTHNLAILSHAVALDFEHRGELSEKERKQRDALWREAFRRWNALLEREGFWSRLASRIRQIDDPQLTTGAARRLRNTLPLALASINARLAAQAAEKGDYEKARRHTQMMRESGLGRKTVDEALNRALEPLCERIKFFCKDASREAKADPLNANRVVDSLLDQGYALRDIFDSILPLVHNLRDFLLDEVVTSACNCLVVFANETQKWDMCIDRLESALEIAVGETVRARVEKDLDKVRDLAREEELETYLDPIHSQIEEIFESAISPQEKFSKLRDEIIPQFESIKAQKDQNSEVVIIGSNMIASALRSISIDLHNDAKDFDAAYEAIRLAENFCRDDELRSKLENDIALISDHLEQERLFKNIKPITSAPTLRTVNGIGTTLYGCSDYDQKTKSYLTTLYFVFFAIPLFPIARYRVIAVDYNGYRFLGKVPLRSFDKWHRAVPIMLLIIFIIALVVENQPTHSPTSESVSIKATPSSPSQPSSSSDNQSRRSSSSKTSKAPPTMPTSPSYADQSTQVEQLKREIDADRFKLRQMESEMESLESRIDYNKQQIDNYASIINRLKRNNDAGIPVDEREYISAVDQHNYYVRVHNAALAELRAKKIVYDKLLDDTNAKIDRYNHMMGAR